MTQHSLHHRPRKGGPWAITAVGIKLSLLGGREKYGSMQLLNGKWSEIGISRSEVELSFGMCAPFLE